MYKWTLFVHTCIVQGLAVFICGIEQERTEVIMRKVTRSPAHANPLFVLGCQGLPADLFRFVIIFLRWFRVCLHVSAVETEKREGETVRFTSLTQGKLLQVELETPDSSPGVASTSKDEKTKRSFCCLWAIHCT